VGKGIVYLSMGNAYTVAVALVTFPFIVRMLTKDEMGAYVAMQMVVYLFAVLSDLGFGACITKIVSERLSREESPWSAVVAGVLARVAALTPMILLYYVFVEALCSLLNTGAYVDSFRLLAAVLVTSSLGSTLSCVLLGFRMIKCMSIAHAIAATVRHFGAAALLYLGLGLWGLVLAWAVAEAALICYSLASMPLPGSSSPEKVGEVLSKLAVIGWPLLIGNLATYIYAWFDRAILIALLPLQQVATYGVAVVAYGILTMFPSIVGTVIFPYYSEQYGRGDVQRIEEAVTKVTRYLSIFYLPLAVGLSVTSYPAITLFAGPRYWEGYLPLGILSISSLVLVVNAPLAHLLIVYERTLKASVITALSATAGIALSFPLLLGWGLAGLALAKATSVALATWMFFTEVGKFLRVEVDTQSFKKAAFSVSVMALVVLALVFVKLHRYLLPLYVLAGGVSYFAALRFTRALDESDFRLIESILGRRLGGWARLLLARL